MSPELRAALKSDQVHASAEDDMFTVGRIDAILQFAEKNPTIPDRALCQCWGDVIQAAIPAALWDRVSKEG